MMLRLSLLLFLLFSMVGAMTLEDMNGDVPPNFAEIMPTELVQCARLASEGRFSEGISTLKKTYGDKIPESVSVDLRGVYDAASKCFISKRDLLDSNLTEVGFIYNQFLRYFWWSHYCYVYDGMTEEIPWIDVERVYEPVLGWLR